MGVTWGCRYGLVGCLAARRLRQNKVKKEKTGLILFYFAERRTRTAQWSFFGWHRVLTLENCF